MRGGGAFVEEDLNHLLAQRGLLGRFFRPMFRLVSRSWHMYPLGFLFGLGFDTATEIGVLGISAAEASKGLPIWSIMVFPALFTAGMSLIDTADGVLMLGAYGWAFTKPIRKLYYNLTITFVSVLVAVLIGGIEALGLLAERLNLEGPFWSFIGALNDNFGSLGYLIIAIFVASWLVSIAIYRLGRFDSLECAPARLSCGRAEPGRRYFILLALVCPQRADFAMSACAPVGMAMQKQSDHSSGMTAPPVTFSFLGRPPPNSGATCRKSFNIRCSNGRSSSATQANATKACASNWPSFFTIITRARWRADRSAGRPAGRLVVAASRPYI